MPSMHCGSSETPAVPRSIWYEQVSINVVRDEYSNSRQKALSR